jgi:hypothetical protein
MDDVKTDEYGNPVDEAMAAKYPGLMSFVDWRGRYRIVSRYYPDDSYYDYETGYPVGASVTRADVKPLRKFDEKIIRLLANRRRETQIREAMMRRSIDWVH